MKNQLLGKTRARAVKRCVCVRAESFCFLLFSLASKAIEAIWDPVHGEHKNHPGKKLRAILHRIHSIYQVCCLLFALDFTFFLSFSFISQLAPRNSREHDDEEKKKLTQEIHKRRKREKIYNKTALLKPFRSQTHEEEVEKIRSK
jgi:hypothetical protein